MYDQWMSRAFWAIIAVGVTLGLGLGGMILSGHGNIANRFDSIDTRFDSVETRLDAVQVGLTNVRSDLSMLAQRVSYIEGQIGVVRVAVTGEPGPGPGPGLEEGTVR